MPRYLISFDDGSMDHIPDKDWPAVGEAAHAVVREAKAVEVWIFGGGIQRQQSSIVATDGIVTRGTHAGDKIGRRRVLDHRGFLTRAGTRLGRTNRESVSVFAGGSRDHVRSRILKGGRGQGMA